MGKAARSIVIDFVVVAQVVYDPKYRSNRNGGYRDAQPHLKNVSCDVFTRAWAIKTPWH